MDLNNSKVLDVHRYSDHPEVNSFVNAIWGSYLADNFKRAQAKSRPKDQLKKLLLDLYVLWSEDPAACLAVPMSNDAYQQERYKKLHITRLLPECVRELHKAGLLELHTGSEAKRQITRIWPAETLLSKFREARFSEFDIKYAGDLVVLSGGDDIDDTDTTNNKTPDNLAAMEAVVWDYNNLLANSFIDIGSLETNKTSHDYWSKEKHRPEERTVRVTQQNKNVRRVFYRQSWDLGGRFHGGFWQQVKSDLRKDILIDDKETIEIDFSGFHIFLAYSLEKQPAPRDPYSLPLVLEDYTKAEQRAVVKSLVLSAINAAERSKAYKAFRNEQQPKTKQKNLTNAQLEQLLELFIANNRPLESYICTDAGVRLMAIDGAITAKLIEYFTDNGIVVLTIHDSYLVHMEHEQLLMDKMKQYTREVTGFEGSLTVEKPSMGLYQQLKRADPNDVHTYNALKALKTTRAEGYLKRLQRWKSFKETTEG
jgi:hypothetical protein